MQTIFYITIALSLVVLVLIFFIIQLYRKLRTLTRGSQAKSLETLIRENNAFVKTLTKEHELMYSRINQLEKDALHAIHNIGVVRFNPFKETGGNQSFALALTNRKNSGVVLSSLYTRDRVNIFAKPLIEGKSEYLLTSEEKEAINRSYY